MASSKPSAADFLGLTTPQTTEAVPPAPEGLAITQRDRLMQDVGQGVDVDTGGSAGVRAGLSVQTPSNVDKYLTESFGQDGWRRTKDGNIVFADKESGKEVLLDEAGFSMKDFADIADAAPQIAGGLAATIAVSSAAGTAGASLPVLALAAAAGGYFTSAVSDALQQANLNPTVIREIADKRGLEAVLDFAFGLGSGTAAKLLSTRFKKPVIDEFSPTAEGIEGAVGRIKEATGVDVPITAGEVTGSPTLQRIESIGEKLPLSSDVFRKTAIDRDVAVNQIQKAAIGTPDPSNVGQEFADQVTRARTRDLNQLTDLRNTIDDNLQTNLNSIGDTLSPGGRGITAESAGETYRATGTLKRDAFLDKTRADFDLARQAPGGKDPIVGTGRITTATNRIEREVPQEKVIRSVEVFDEAGSTLDDLSVTPSSRVVSEQTGQKPARAFIPPQVKRFLDSLKNLDNMTIDQARQGRNLIYDAIQESEALPGINTRFLKILSREFTASIDDAVTELPDGRLKTALDAANKHYKENADQFLEPGIVEIFRSPTAPGFVEDSGLVDKSLKSIERIKRVKKFLGPESKEWGVFVRSAYNDMFDKSRNINKKNMLDVKKLSDNLSRMNPEIAKELFGKNANKMIENVRKLSVSAGDVPLSSIDDLSGGMATALRTAAIREKALSKEYNDRVLKPFLRDEVGATDMNPDDFTRHVMTEGDLSDIDKMFKILGTNNPQRDKFERSVIQDLLQKGTVPASAEDIVSGQIKEGDDIISGRALFNAIKNGYGKRSAEKIEKVIGKDRMILMKDLATVQASKEQKAKSAAGGLISGFIISSLARGDFSSLPMIAQYKVLSWALTNKQMIGLLKSRKIPVGATMSKPAKIASVMTGPMINDLVNFVGPEDATKVLDVLGVPAESRPDKPSASDFLQLDIDQINRGVPDIRLRAQEQ